jgi:predicted lipoprotein with Yx(FWY)xxD motif
MPVHLSRRGRSALAVSALAFAGLLPLGAGGAGAASRHSTSHSPAPLVVRSTKHGKLGQILETAKGFTLYHFTHDTSTKLACNTGCTLAWPPLMLPKGLTHATAGAGVVQANLGKIKRGAGWQVTYKGEPVYTYSGDSGPGQTTGEGVGGTWFVVKLAAPAAKTTSSLNSTSGW